MKPSEYVNRRAVATEIQKNINKTYSNFLIYFDFLYDEEIRKIKALDESADIYRAQGALRLLDKIQKDIKGDIK